MDINLTIIDTPLRDECAVSDLLCVDSWIRWSSAFCNGGPVILCPFLAERTSWSCASWNHAGLCIDLLKLYGNGFYIFQYGIK